MVIWYILCVFYHNVNKKEKFCIRGTCRHFLPVPPLGPQVPESLTRTRNPLVTSSDKNTVISSWAHSSLSFQPAVWPRAGCSPSLSLLSLCEKRTRLPH